MNGQPPEGTQQRAFCDEFETLWLDGERPQIEDILVRAATDEQDELFAWLLQIELRIRQEQGELPPVQEYCRRFPVHRQAIESFFRDNVPHRLGDYEILEMVGQGGMGVVYRAQHTLLHQEVALKVLPRRLWGDPQAVARFRREMLSTGQLNHPNLIRAFNAGEERGFHYLVTEYVDGITFRDLVERQGPVPIGATSELIRQAAVGLQYVHANRLVHRDIKPANLMLTRDGKVKILDLGLARLQQGATSRELTQPGHPMGTVDYMAPEQWVDSSSVDIRADIYSLGATTFYLLTGKAPTETDSQDTQPRRFTLHKKGPLPSVSQQCRDCPKDLEKLVASMLAEEADDRPNTPGEVAGALSRYASADQVAELLRTASSTAGSPVRRTGTGLSDTLGTASQKSVLPSRGSASRRQSEAMQRKLRVLKLAGPLVALGLVLIIWLALQFGKADVSPVEQRSPEAVRLAAATATEIGGLPGLNGLWWFDESPWLTPFVRQAIADDLLQGRPSKQPSFAPGPDGNPALSSNVEAVQDWLLRLARDSQSRLTASEVSLLDQLVQVSQEDLTDELLAARLQSGLDRFVGELGPESSWSAMDLHTRAVLQHKIATVCSDRELAEAAAGSYAAATTAYKALGPAQTPLRARCLVDAGQLQSRVFKDYAEAKRRFREAITLPDAPLLLTAEAWVQEAIASAVANPDAADKYTEAGFALTSAQQLLKATGLRDNYHPFAAHVHERYAWILMDQWSVRKAAAEFKDARSIRFDNFWKTKNAFAQIFVFHNDHGQAMAERYCGDVKIARAQYDLVIGEIEKALTAVEAEPDRLGMQRFRRELRERYSNSCERRADCELYQGAAAGAAVDLKEAARLYTIAQQYADDPAVRAAMTCKRAVILALNDQAEEGEREFRQDQALKMPVIGIHEERVRLLRKLCDAVLTLKKSDVEAGLTGLRSFLRELDLDPNYPDRHRRETQELQLFAAELLVATELNDPQRLAAATADADYLDRLIAAFPYREQMLVYLRRFYDLLIAAREQVDPDRAAGYILASRDQRPVADATLVLFHFVGERGRVIVRPVDERCRLFPLNFGREQIKTPKSESPEVPPVALPDELMQLLAAEREAGRTLAVFWDDSKCWARPENALTQKDWPFDSQLGCDGQLRSSP